MKKSIKYLPVRKQRDLEYLVKLIRENIEDCEMIILFGSYARNDYVDYDQRTEFGLRTCYMSDYDILVVTRRKISIDLDGQVFEKIRTKFSQYKPPYYHTVPQFINESISNLNRDLSRGAYFYTEIKKQGVILYDSGNFTLERPRKLNFDEIYEIAKGYYDDKFPYATEFIEVAKSELDSDSEKIKYRMAAFLLHQAAENFLRTIPLVYILYGYKSHKLAELMGNCKKHTTEIFDVFPQDTDEEKRLFELLQESYVQARYNKDFVVTREDLEALIPKVEHLGTIVEKVCRKQLDYYLEMAGKPKSPKTAG